MSDMFDFFEGTPTKPRREKSLRDKEKEAQVRYSRMNGGRSMNCDDCIDHVIQHGGTPHIRPATIMRTKGDEHWFLCSRHATERRDKEDLERLKGK